MSAAGELVRRIPAPILVIAGIISLQVGAAIAKSFFHALSPTTFVWLRLLCTAILLLAVARPRLSGRSRGDLVVALAFGACLAIMNFSIYHAMARIPLGVAVTIEFLGPLGVAIVASRRLADVILVVLAGAGVALLGFAPHGLNLAGVLFALAAATSWAGYILLSTETGRRWPGISGLAVASVVGALGLAVPAILQAGQRLLDPQLLIIGLTVALMSSVIPYSLELNALRRIPRGVFGVLMSLEPAAAALAGMVVIGEFLKPGQWLAIACIITASVGTTSLLRRPRGDR
ncbi:DMT family transporter [Microlunatus sp. Gsoil 973]|uniref:EamA family transporter n=1 Tax=Microlunatus sp. Gsoil 973 TaxID=2672569 RepID=UPI0012B449D3|nr:EamA family transporter [Microlunatus sp. Gsoil 973]QGN33851.1 EamA family transporter [Microlunatus sp. Gsoil 973]